MEGDLSHFVPHWDAIKAANLSSKPVMAEEKTSSVRQTGAAVLETVATFDSPDGSLCPVTSGLSGRH